MWRVTESFGESQALRSVMRLVQIAAPVDTSVLLLGRTMDQNAKLYPAVTVASFRLERFENCLDWFNTIRLKVWCFIKLYRRLQRTFKTLLSHESSVLLAL